MQRVYTCQQRNVRTRISWIPSVGREGGQKQPKRFKSLHSQGPHRGGARHGLYGRRLDGLHQDRGHRLGRLNPITSACGARHPYRVDGGIPGPEVFLGENIPSHSHSMSGAAGAQTKMDMKGMAIDFVSRTLVIGGVLYALDMDGIDRRWGPAFKVGAAGAVGSMISQAWVEDRIKAGLIS